MGRWMMLLLLLLGFVVGCRDEQETQSRTDPRQAAGELALPAAPGGEVSPEEVTRLIDQLGSTKFSERISAALRLGKSGAPEAASALLAALRDECALSDRQVEARNMEGPGLTPAVASGFVKGAYQMGLWKLGPQVREEVQGELARADGEFHDWLVIVLGYLGDKEQLEPLMTLAQGSPDGFVREAAARALGHLGRAEAIPVLQDALNDPFVVQMHDVRIPLVREAARAALRQLGAQEQ